MGFWRLLKKKIFWYKEYFFLIFLGIIIIGGILLYLPQKAHVNPIENKPPQKVISAHKIVKAQKVLPLIYPDPNLFNQVIKNNEIDIDEFIKEYKAYFKIHNALAGKASLIFAFYEQKNLIYQVEIKIKINLNNGQTLEGIQKLNLVKNQ